MKTINEKNTEEAIETNKRKQLGTHSSMAVGYSPQI
jgi:hypothetical protein